MTIAISGVGLVTAFGAGVGRSWDGLLAGRRALRPTPVDDLRREAQAPVLARTPHALGGTRETLAGLALTEAIEGSGLPCLPESCLVIGVAQAPPLGDPMTRAFSGLDTTAVAGVPDRADRVTLSHACASAAFAVLLARDWLESGLTDVAVVLGGCVLNPHEYAGMAAVRALSATGALPFDRRRDGTSLGEGAGAVVLERVEGLVERGGVPAALVAGGECRVVAEAAAATGTDAAAACVAAALDDAGVRSVDYVHAHATGTVQGDLAELTALERIGEDLDWAGVPVSSHKGAVGHLMQSAAFPAIAAACRAMATGWIPPTAGLCDPEPTGSAVRLATRAERLAQLDTVLVPAFGFGGNMATLVLTAGGGSTQAGPR